MRRQSSFPSPVALRARARIETTGQPSHTGTSRVALRARARIEARTEQVISDYMEGADEGTGMDTLVEAAAEYFVKSTKTDGNIWAFAHPKTIEMMLNRI